MNHKTDIREALRLCIDAMLHDGVPTDPEHPKRVALNAAEAALVGKSAGVPEGWRKLCRRLYVELFHCDQQMRSTRDQHGDPHWTQSAVVRVVLKDAKAALAAAPAPVSEPEQPVEANVSIHVECYECRECDHVGIDDAHPTDAACGYPCGWSGPSTVEDKCPGCGKTNVISSACPKCSGLYRMIAEADIASTSEHPSERGERPIEPEDIDAVAEAIQRETSVEWLIASRAAVAAIDTLIARGNHASEHGEQDCPHGVDDGACKQCYGEAVSGEQGAPPITDHVADDRKLVDAASAPTLGDDAHSAFNDLYHKVAADISFYHFERIYKFLTLRWSDISAPTSDDQSESDDLQEQVEDLRKAVQYWSDIAISKHCDMPAANAVKALRHYIEESDGITIAIPYELGNALIAASAPTLTPERDAFENWWNAKLAAGEASIDIAFHMFVELTADSVQPQAAEPKKSIGDFLDAPKLFTQVYCCAVFVRGWPSDMALSAAREAVDEFGDDPSKSVADLEAVLSEVLRTY